MTEGVKFQTVDSDREGASYAESLDLQSDSDMVSIIMYDLGGYKTPQLFIIFYIFSTTSVIFSFKRN